MYEEHSSLGDLPTEQELDRAEKAAAERIERFSRAAERIKSLVVTEEAPRGLVRVTVDSSGALRSIDLGAHATRMTATEIVPVVTTCIQRAQAQIADHVQQVMTQEAGNDPTAERATDDYRNRFPKPPEVEPGTDAGRAEHFRFGPPTEERSPRPAPPRRPARPRRPDNDDDWAERPIMRATEWHTR